MDAVGVHVRRGMPRWRGNGRRTSCVAFDDVALSRRSVRAKGGKRRQRMVSVRLLEVPSAVPGAPGSGMPIAVWPYNRGWSLWACSASHRPSTGRASSSVEYSISDRRPQTAVEVPLPTYIGARLLAGRCEVRPTHPRSRHGLRPRTPVLILAPRTHDVPQKGRGLGGFAQQGHGTQHGGPVGGPTMQISEFNPHMSWCRAAQSPTLRPLHHWPSCTLQVSGDPARLWARVGPPCRGRKERGPGPARAWARPGGAG